MSMLGGGVEGAEMSALQPSHLDTSDCYVVHALDTLPYGHCAHLLMNSRKLMPPSKPLLTESKSTQIDHAEGTDPTC